jgi:hypothetical protein
MVVWESASCGSQRDMIYSALVVSKPSHSTLLMAGSPFKLNVGGWFSVDVIWVMALLSLSVERNGGRLPFLVMVCMDFIF